MKRSLKHKTHNSAPVAVVQRQTRIEREQLSRSANVLQRTAAKSPAALRPADILALQQTVGNRVVQRMLHRTEEDKPLKGHSLSRRETGLPDGLKVGVESLSGISMDDVRVHYNSPKPAELQARAYAQGTDIYLGPNEEEHLPHEAWHVVQQRQGRVRPTTILAKGLSVNDDSSLEREADVMGSQALRMMGSISPVAPYRVQKAKPITHFTTGQPIQRNGRDVKEESDRMPDWHEALLDQLRNVTERDLRVLAAYRGLSDLHDYMISPYPFLAWVELNELLYSAPEIEGAPRIRTTDTATILRSLRERLKWLVDRKDSMNAGQRNEVSMVKRVDDPWAYKAMIHHFKPELDPIINANLNPWLDDVIARTKNLNRLWEVGSRAVSGTYGTIPEAIVQELFRKYPQLTRKNLTDAVNRNIPEDQVVPELRSII